MKAIEARDQIIIAMQRCCGAACAMAMDQVPSVADPELRAAFTSWARLDTPAAAGPAGVGRAKSGHRRNGEVVEVTP